MSSVASPSPSARARSRDDDAVAARVLLATTAIVGALLSVYASMQSALVLGVFSEALRGADPAPLYELVLRTSVNLATVGLVVLAAAFVHLERRTTIERVALVVVIALGAAAARSVVQVSVGIYLFDDARSRSAVVTEIATTSVVLALTLVAGLLHYTIWRRSRRADRRRLAAQHRATELLGDLQDEELRVRREVAATIHGSVQNVFIVLEAQLDDVSARIGDTEAKRVRTVREHLRTLREGELRALSGRLYPVDLERGLVAAVQTLTVRIPAHVSVTLDGVEELARVTRGEAPQATEVLIARIVEEGLANALRHGGARRIAIRTRVDETSQRVSLGVDSDGAPPAASPELSGLERLRRHVDLLDGTLSLTAGGELGTRLTAEFSLTPVPALSGGDRI